MEEEKNTTEQALRAAVLRILNPLVRLLLRYGMSYGAFADLAKRVYVDVANRDFRIEGRKQTTSRVSVLTGLSRKEVSRVAALDVPTLSSETKRYNRAARVIAGWISDPKFADASGAPSPLVPEGVSPNFSELVRAHSGDVPARAILDELVRVGAVERLDDGRVQLRTSAYIPSTEEVAKLEILGSDVADLTATIDHNLQSNPESAFFQRKVSYDNIPAEAVAEIRAESAAEGQRLLELLNVRMSAADRDMNPKVQGTGRKRVMVGIYYRESDCDEEPNDNDS